MSRLVVETRGVAEWRSRLADPTKQWKRGYSAFEVAVAWEGSASGKSGMPLSILGLLDQHKGVFPNPKLIVGIVEHKVELPGGKHPSQNDVWALVRVGQDLLSLAIEAKAGESFADLISVWKEKKEPGSDKPKRLDYLKDVLGISKVDVDDVRYQLLHRTASALIEAERVGAKYAAMIVQSFRNPHRKSDPKKLIFDFQTFARKFGASAEENQLVPAGKCRDIQLYLGWVTCDPATDAEVAAKLEAAKKRIPA